MRSKDIILFPSWSRQADEADHFLLCVEFLLIFLVVIFPNSTGRVSEFDFVDINKISIDCRFCL